MGDRESCMTSLRRAINRLQECKPFRGRDDLISDMQRHLDHLLALDEQGLLECSQGDRGGLGAPLTAGS